MSARRAVAAGLAVTLTTIVLQIIPAAAAGAETHNAVRTWGDNATAQLGNGSIVTPSAGSLAEPIGALDRVTALAGGGGHSLAVAAGVVWSWGKDDKGQLGRGMPYNASPLAPPRPPQSTPGAVVIDLAAGVTITAVAAGAAHSLALASDGKVWAWGDDSSGQLGDSTLTPKATPTQVLTIDPKASNPSASAVNPQPLTGITAIAAGANHSLALKTDGTVWAWGNNSSGQLGNGTYVPNTTAAAVPGILSAITGNAASGVSAIAAGPNHSLAVVAPSGNVVAWGDNTDNQLGASTTATTNTPIATQVVGISTARTVAGGTGISLATTTTDQVFSWGRASLIGRPTTSVPNTAPGAVPNLTGAFTVAAHGGHVLVLNTATGAVWSWGNNGSGQLGRSGDSSNTPTTILSVTSATVIAAGDSQSLAVVRPRATVSPAPPANLDFGSVTVNGNGVAKTITITNAGPGQLVVDPPASLQPEFSIANGCTSPVKEGSSCPLTVTFTPTNVQVYSFDLPIVSNNFAGPLTVHVTGVGVLPAGTLDITTDNSVVPSTPSAVPLNAIPINPQAPDFPRAVLPNLRLGVLPNLRLGDLSNLRLGVLPNLRLGVLPNLRLGVLPNLRLGDMGAAATSVLGQITLNQIPISYPGGWAAVLAGTSLAGPPIQNVTYLQVISLPDDQKTVFAQLTIGDIFNFKGTGTTASAFGSVGFLALLLGKTTTLQAPLPAGDPGWCLRLEHLGYPSCGASLRNTAPNYDARDASPFELDLAGVAYGAVNADGPIPIDQIRFAGMTLAADAPVQLLHLAEITTYATSDLGAIKLSTTPDANAVVTCAAGVDCTNWTLNDAAKANAIKPDALFSQLGHAVDNLTLGNVGYGLLPPEALGIDGAPLGDLGILGYRPESSPPMPSDIRYHLTFTSTAADATITNPTVTVTLPDEFTFVPGSATASVTDSPSFEPGDPTLSGQTITWASLGHDVGPGKVLHLDFTGQPGLELGSFTITDASLKDGGSTFIQRLGGPVAPVLVVESMEPNSTAGTAIPLQPDTLYISHVSTGLDKDYFSVPVQPKGTMVSVRLSHLPADYDLSVYFPAGMVPMEPSLRAVAPWVRPLSSLPEDKIGTSNLAGTLATDQHDDIDTHACPAGTNAGPTCSNLPVAGISQNRQSANAVLGEGTNETVEFVSPGGAAGSNFIIEVAGFGQASSNHPYGVRNHNTAPPDDVVASPRPAPFTYASGTPAAIPSTTKTLFISAPTRLTALYGATASQAVTTAITQVINDATVGPVVGGVLLNVDADATVQADFKAWDLNPYSAGSANQVVRDVNALIDRQLPPAQNQIENVVVVGSDEVIPFGRVFEADVAANERTFAAELAAQIGGGNAIVGSMASGHILTDDPYVGTPVLLPGRFIYTSSIAHGRLVETASEIQGALDRFRTSAGKVDPHTALTTGYDFMADEATAVNNVLAAKLGAANAQSLISDTWTRQQLLSAYTGATPVPDIVSINGHTDAARTLPPAETTTGGLFTTQDLPASLSNRLIFTMGCHSGLSLADVLVSSPSDSQRAALADWAQTSGARGAAGFAGQTGYGVGSSSTIAYSEELMVSFAQNLGTMSAGQALAAAKSAYFAGTATFDAVHEKTMMQATYFGMPNFTFTTPTAKTADAKTSAAPATTVDPTTGLTVAAIHTAPAFHKNTTSDGTFYDVSADTQVANNRPVEPRVRIDVTQPGTTAHGALITGLASTDNPDNALNAFDPVLVRPTLDQRANEPEAQTGDVVFPAAIQGVGTFNTPAGARDQLTLVTGRFMSCALSDPGCGTSAAHKTLGNQRNYTSVDALVHYSTCSSFTPPTFDLAVGTVDASTAFFSAHVTPAGPATVKRVVVMYQDALGWKKLDLGSSNHVAWSGSASISGSGLEFFMEAVDSCGNVAVTTNKGSLYRPSPVNASVFEFVFPPAPASGWYTGPVDMTIAGANQITYSLDGAAYQPYSGPFTVSTDGVHFVTAQGWDGHGNAVSGSTDIPIDSTPPTITVSSPSNGAYTAGQVVTASYSCADTTSGVASCVGTVANGARIDTTPGQHAFQVTATDVAGTSATYAVSYGVSYQFIGFLQGVSNDSMNAANAGRTIPMKWQLKDASGNYISATGTVKSTTSYRIDCHTGEPITTLPASSTTTKSGLSYDSSNNQFTYGWVTDATWLTTCRRFALVLDDSSVHTADFKFT